MLGVYVRPLLPLRGEKNWIFRREVLHYTETARDNTQSLYTWIPPIHYRA